jgi:cytochrome c556
MDFHYRYDNYFVPLGRKQGQHRNQERTTKRKDILRQLADEVRRLSVFHQDRNEYDASRHLHRAAAEIDFAAAFVEIESAARGGEDD